MPTMPASGSTTSAQVDRSSLRRDSRGSALRHVPLACVDDGQRYAVQHERERGDLEPLLPSRGHAAWEQGPGSSQRPHQHGPVIQRHVSLGNEHRGGSQCEAAAYPGGEGVARCGCGEGFSSGAIVFYRLAAVSIETGVALILARNEDMFVGKIEIL
jgi:hypothetical protein